MSLGGLLVVAGDVRLEGVAAAVERVVSVLVVQDAGEADLPLVAVAAQLGVQTQAAAVQVLQKVGGRVAERQSTGRGGEEAAASEHARCDTGTHHQGLGAWPGQAGEGLPQEGGNLQQ